MITLYRVAECEACDIVQGTLRNLVVAHQVVDVEKAQPAKVPAVVTGQALPVIADGEKVISGEAALHTYLNELAAELEQWRKFQVDACYVDDKGKTC